MVGHLSDEDVRRYVAGLPNVQADRHVRVCIFCAQRLGAAAQEAVHWERRGLLGRLVRTSYAEEIDQLLAEIEEERRHAA